MKKIICILLFLFPFLLLATEFKDVIWHRCYDGDTCTFTINGVHPLLGDKIGVRLSGIDTPEIRGKCPEEKQKAYEARDFLVKYLENAEEIILAEVERGKYFRLAAAIYADGVSLNEEMIRAGHAVPYDGETKKRDWCKADNTN